MKTITLPSDLETELDLISSWMFPNGSQKRICELSGYRQPFVSEMLNKKAFPTPKFMKAARMVMKENQAAFEVQPFMKAS